MKKLCALLLVGSLVVTSPGADLLGDKLEVTPAPGWKSDDPAPSGWAQPPFPTLRYVPEDGRNAAILLSLLPVELADFTVSDEKSLEAFLLMAARPYLPSPDARPPVTKLKIADGIGAYLVNEDPALVGKPVPPGEYRFAVTAALVLDDRYLVHGTIFFDERDSADFKEALKILQSTIVRHSRSTI
jgi:hypothetical protein